MQEIEFYFNWDKYEVIFSDGTICKIDYDNECFYYKDKKFTLESDVEKDLCYAFNIKYINIIE
ncbi:hypothetical protein [Cetobacterium sp.]|uniref:hypothetical protein n=1 Tax=Cetobacterium sp. TaxID=2071632 RepID=UPI003F35B155